MKYLLILPRVIWKTIFLLNFVLGLLVLYPFFAILLSRKAWFPAAFRLKKFWAAWIMLIPGLFLSVKRKVPVSALPKTCIYCGNHVSYLDIIASYLVIPNYYVFMGKQELDKAPLFRIFFKEMNILVDRSSNIGSHRAFLRAGADLDKGSSVFLFPEGTISSAGKLRGFKNGAFKLARDERVRILPVAIHGAGNLLPKGRAVPGEAHVKIIVLPAIPPPAAGDDLDAFAEKVRQDIMKAHATLV